MLTEALKRKKGQEIINALKEHRVRMGDKTGHVAVRHSDERTLEENTQQKTDNDALLAYLSQQVPESLLKVRENHAFTASFNNH